MAAKRVLFVSENVSLAQVVRLKQLASALDRQRFEVSFAASSFDPMIFDGTCFDRHTIESISAGRMHRRLAFGRRLYDTRTLAGYVREEMGLLERLAPDLVVGDLRLSLCVTAPSVGVPYAALINAYWNAADGSFPMPEHPVLNWIGVDRVAPHFHKGLPFVFDHFARPINTLRRRHGLTSIGSLVDVLTYGDHVLYPDVPELTPVAPHPAHHHFLGPVVWAPRVPLPAFWHALDDTRPIVYVTMGSSGSLRAARTVVEGLGSLPVQVLLASAGRFRHEGLPDNVFAADYLPGDLACRRARLVICNGGSSTGYQALNEGTPVLGLPFNLDQYLSMAAIERVGAGRVLRSGTVTAPQVRAATLELLDDASSRRSAAVAGKALRRLDARARFRAFVEVATGAGRISLDAADAKPTSTVCPNTARA